MGTGDSQPVTPPAGGQIGIKTLSGDIANGGIGVNFGHIHQYLVAAGASPEERVRAARDCLRAGLREQAEKLLNEAVAQDYRSIDTYYYRMLALLSHRSPEELTNEHWVQLRQLLAPLRPDQPLPSPDPGGYYAASRTVGTLLHAAVQPRGTAGPAANGATGNGVGADGWAGQVEAMRAALPGERREEIDSQLRQLIERVRQDRRDSAEEAEVHARRTAGDRVRRVPYFFTADPLPPREPDTSAAWVLRLAGGALLACAGIAGLASITDGVGSRGGGIVLGLIASDANVVGGFLAWLFVTQLAATAMLVAAAFANAQVDALARQLRRWPGLVAATTGTDRGHQGRLAFLAALVATPEGGRPAGGLRDPEMLRHARFRDTVETLVSKRFNELHPAPPRSDADWFTDNYVWRLQLTGELTHDYWRSGNAAALDWMIQRRAAEVAQSWSAGELRIPSPRSIRGGLALVVLHLLLILMISAATLLPSAVALWAAALGGSRLAARGLVEQQRLTMLRQRYAADLAVHGPLAETMRASRPSDLEMAEWLDLDKRCLMAEMRGEHRMEGRDILFSFFVVEAAADCVRARVGGGPARYSGYLAKLFVLTSRGVWTSSWQVDAATGIHTGRNDVVFRYDAISSAMLDTVGRGPEGNADDIGGALRYGPGDRDGPPREALRLVLANRQYLDVVLENYALLESGEDAGRLRELARDTSGAADGFRTLAALATEGKRWIDQRREYARAALLGPATAPAPTGAGAPP